MTPVSEKQTCGTCKHKGEPMDRKLKQWAKTTGALFPVRKAIGYDAGEGHRLTKTSPAPALWTAWYPLGEWGWDREKCREVATAAGFRCVAKSACFFCPAMKKAEIVAMSETHPDLMTRALAIEDGLAPRTRAVLDDDGEIIGTEPAPKIGLGGTFRWRDVLTRDRDQSRLDYEENVFVPCGCSE